MKRLLGLLLVMGMVGCGGGDPVTELEELGARIRRVYGEFHTVSLDGTQITDAGIAELKKALPKCKIRK